MKTNQCVLIAGSVIVGALLLKRFTTVLGAETFGADCTSQGYETNAPNGYTGNAAIITLNTPPNISNCTHPPCVKVQYTQRLGGGTGVAAHYFDTAYTSNPIVRAKQFAVQYDPTGYWIDKTVAANTVTCDPIASLSSASLVACDSCCPACPASPPVVKCDSCCPTQTTKGRKPPTISGSKTRKWWRW